MITVEPLSHPTPEEKSRILSIYHQQKWWPETLSDPERIGQMIRGSHCYVVARDKREIIGIGRALSDGVGDAYLHDITVVKSHRRQGVGRQIVAMLMERLEKDGITWMGLIAEKGSPALYRKFGFTALEGAIPMFRFETDPTETSFTS
ncbi:GNAT family N-acetyltransferase [Desulfoluna sp.]|uniref:GNAT family N-acetyltransferase n=1 Tax=Desulfoluna sp. TaxID=2045199 RepID=UPI002614B01D|nr:GNAT family N-acetyltransferase [Desulfoluna sp.]